MDVDKQQVIQALIDSDSTYSALLQKGDHVGLALALNTKSATKLDRAVIPTAEVLQAIDVNEFAALDTTQLMAIQIVLSLSTGGLTPKAIDLLVKSFGEMLNTVDALRAISKQSASPVELVLGVGAVVTTSDLGEIYKKPDQIQTEKVLFIGDAWLIEAEDGTQYPMDAAGNILRDQPLKKAVK